MNTINLIKIIIESPHEHVDTYKILFLFKKSLKSYSSFYSQHFLWSQYTIPLQALELYRLSWLNPISKAFTKIYYFPKFHCHFLGASKLTSCSIFNYFEQILIATSFERQVIQTIFWGLFEDTKNTTRFPNRYICNTIEINMLFAIFKNKGLRNFKVRLNHTILKGMNAG